MTSMFDVPIWPKAIGCIPFGRRVLAVSVVAFALQHGAIAGEPAKMRYLTLVCSGDAKGLNLGEFRSTLRSTYTLEVGVTSARWFSWGNLRAPTGAIEQDLGNGVKWIPPAISSDWPPPSNQDEVRAHPERWKFQWQPMKQLTKMTYVLQKLDDAPFGHQYNTIDRATLNWSISAWNFEAGIDVVGRCVERSLLMPPV